MCIQENKIMILYESTYEADIVVGKLLKQITK